MLRALHRHDAGDLLRRECVLSAEHLRHEGDQREMLHDLQPVVGLEDGVGIIDAGDDDDPGAVLLQGNPYDLIMMSMQMRS